MINFEMMDERELKKSIRLVCLCYSIFVCRENRPVMGNVLLLTSEGLYFIKAVSWFSVPAGRCRSVRVLTYRLVVKREMWAD